MHIDGIDARVVFVVRPVAQGIGDIPASKTIQGFLTALGFIEGGQGYGHNFAVRETGHRVVLNRLRQDIGNAEQIHQRIVDTQEAADEAFPVFFGEASDFAEHRFGRLHAGISRLKSYLQLWVLRTEVLHRWRGGCLHLDCREVVFQFYAHVQRN